MIVFNMSLFFVLLFCCRISLMMPYEGEISIPREEVFCVGGHLLLGHPEMYHKRFRTIFINSGECNCCSFIIVEFTTNRTLLIGGLCILWNSNKIVHDCLNFLVSLYTT